MLIGFNTRTRGFSVHDGAYKYKIPSPSDPSYSIILPALFLHRAYLEMMFDRDMIAGELVAYIDQIMNCDDILMSVMVTKFLTDCGWPQSGGLELESSFLIANLEHLSKCCGGNYS